MACRAAHPGFDRLSLNGLEEAKGTLPWGWVQEENEFQRLSSKREVLSIKEH
jgi:hypothetical protein